MSSLFGLKKPNTDLKKNVFDLSEKTLFTMSAGMLLPCMTRELNPGEKVKFNMSSFTRTMPLNTAAFLRCKQYHHFFFVPFKQLWNGWDNFINGVDYKTSSLQSGKDYDKIPTMNIFTFLRELYSGTNYLFGGFSHGELDKNNTQGLDEHGFDYIRGISRLLDMLGYGFSYKLTDEDIKKFAPRGYRYKYIKTYSELFDFLHLRYSYIKKFKGLYFFDGFDGTDIPEDIVSKLKEEYYSKYGTGYYDPYGHGGHYDLTDWYTSLMSGSSASNKPLTEDELNKSLFRGYYDDVLAFLDKLNGEDDDNVLDFGNGNSPDSKYRVNPFRILAYQKIYSDFYKRDDYEKTDPFNFNIDDEDQFEGMSFNGFVGGYNIYDPAKRMLGILRLRYRWLPKDYFTGVVPSELFNVSSNFLSRISEDIAGLGSQANPLSVSRNGNNGVTLNSEGAGITTKSIRAAFAIEKMLRLTRRAGGQDYISQISAHYGFEPPKGRGDKVEFLGGYSTHVEVNEVMTQANTERGSVGELRGNGVAASSDNKPIEFTAKEHGVLMCITSIVPELDYEATGLNPFNAKVFRGDYFHPEFQDLGLQPVFGYELRNGLEDNARYRNGIIGYVPRYSEYKTAFDTAHGSFLNGRNLSSWTALNGFDVSEDGSGAMINTMKVNPRVLNSVFSVTYDGTEQTDQFLVQSYFDIKVIRPMSVTGQKL